MPLSLRAPVSIAHSKCAFTALSTQPTPKSAPRALPLSVRGPIEAALPPNRTEPGGLVMFLSRQNPGQLGRSCQNAYFDII